MQITDLQMVHKELDNSYIPQYIVVVNIKMSKCGIEGKCSQKHNTHYLRIKCVLQTYHKDNAYCVRIVPARTDLIAFMARLNRGAISISAGR